MTLLEVENQDQVLRSVMDLARTCEYDAGHTQLVTRLALCLFDQLTVLHDLGPRERFLLHCGALLHDIGWVEGWKGHHKVSQRIILETPLLPFDNKERLVIGCIARYHRKSLPVLGHDHYAALGEEEQQIVLKLAALLRLADGLDSTHQQHVSDLACKVKPKKVIVSCFSPDPVPEEMKAARSKSDLFEQVFKKRVEIVRKETS